MKYLPALVLVLASVVGCTAKEQSPQPLPPIGTKGLSPHTVLMPATNVADVLSQKDTAFSLCWVTEQTPIISVSNHANGIHVFVMLEENAEEDQYYLNALQRTDPTKFVLCKKGAIVDIDAGEMVSAAQNLQGREGRRAAVRDEKKDILKTLTQEE
jgi:hypothetical protein